MFNANTTMIKWEENLCISFYFFLVLDTKAITHKKDK